MRGSWAQHSTVVAQRSRQQVRDLFREAGRQVRAEGKAPLLISDPTTTFYVDRGALDLFLVEVRDGAAVGRRFHCARAEADELVLEFELLPYRPEVWFGILAVGVPGTRIFAMDRERLVERAIKSGALDALHGAVDHWVRRISGGLTARALPANRIELQPGGVVDLASGAMATAGPKTLWVQQIAGISKLVGTTPIGARTPLYPVTRESWIEAEGEVKLRVLDTQTYFLSDPAWTSVAGFHRLVLSCLARRVLAAREAEIQQLVDREQIAANSVSTALKGLAADRIDEAVLDAAIASEPLVLTACREIGRALSVPILAPSDLGAMRAEDVARASRLRVRPVLLPKDWMKVLREPVLGFLGSMDHPVAIIPRRFGGQDLYDPLRGQRVRCTEETTTELLPSAYMFYRPLPARPLEMWDLLRFASFGMKWDLIALAGTGAVLGLLAMVVPWATGKMIDELIPGAEHTALLHVGVALVVVAFATAWIQIVRGSVAMRLEMRSSASLQAAVWDRLLSLPVPFFREYASADLALRANSVETLRTALSGGTLTALLTSISSLFNFVLMMVYDVELASVAAVLALISVFIAAGVGVASVLIRRELAEVDGKVASLVLQLLSGISKLRVAGAERRAFTLWAKQFAKKRLLGHRSREVESGLLVVNAAWPTLMSIVMFQMVASSTELGTGQFIAFNVAFGIFVAGLVELTKNSVELLHLVPVMERARPLFEATPEVDDDKQHPGKLRGAIQVSHVSFRYSPDGPLILDDVDFEIAPGEFIAIVGASAAGKSTLLRVMLGFEKPDSGSVSYDRQQLASLDVIEVRRQLGVVLQTGQPVQGDIMENIFASRRLTIQDAWEAARAAGLAEDIERMPMKMHTVLNQGATSLSGGQRQRLMIARAIVTKPRILFFDEATSALDNETQAQVTKSLERLQATRVVVAHRLSTIENADRIIVLERGRVVQVGTYTELMEVEGVFKDIARRQTA
jgi:NHLM bacteriocin system ABC transporter ATP-binding protein